MNKKKGGTSKKQVKSTLFSASLLDNGVPQRVSRFLDTCFEYLERNDGLKTEGLFRMCGSKPDIQLLKEKVNADPDNFTLDSTSINDVTGLLKQFFGDIPDPLLTFELYFAFIAASGAPDEGRQATIKTVVNLLPIDNKILLNKICKFLHRVSSHSDVNLMSPTNLATCIAFNLIRPEVDDPKTIIGDASLICTLFTSLITDPEYFLPGIDTSFPDIKPTEEHSDVPMIDIKDVDHQENKIKDGLKCGLCDKPLYAAECQKVDNVHYHPACVRKKASNNNNGPWSSNKEIGGNTKEIGGNTKDTNNHQNGPLASNTMQPVNQNLSNLAQQYQVHRNKSQMRLNQLQKKNNLSNEQFEENLQNLSHKIKDGEILAVEEQEKEEMTVDAKREKSEKQSHKPDKFEAKLEKLLASKEKEKEKENKEKEKRMTKSERQRKETISPRDLGGSKPSNRGPRIDRAVSDTPEPRCRRQASEEGDELGKDRSASWLLTNWGKQISAKFIEKRKPKLSSVSTPTIHERSLSGPNSNSTINDRRTSVAVGPNHNPPISTINDRRTSVAVGPSHNPPFSTTSDRRSVAMGPPLSLPNQPHKSAGMPPPTINYPKAPTSPTPQQRKAKKPPS